MEKSQFEDECIFLKNMGNFDCESSLSERKLPTAISSLTASFESVKPFSPEPSTCALQVLLRRCEAFGKIQDFSVWFNSRLSWEKTMVNKPLLRPCLLSGVRLCWVRLTSHYLMFEPSFSALLSWTSLNLRTKKKRRGSVCDILPFQINPNRWFIMRWVDAWCNYKWWVSNHPENTQFSSTRTTSPPETGSWKTKTTRQGLPWIFPLKHHKSMLNTFRKPPLLCYANRWCYFTSPQKRNMDEPQKKTVNIACFSGISFPNKNCMYRIRILSVWDFSEAQPKKHPSKNGT